MQTAVALAQLNGIASKENQQHEDNKRYRAYFRHVENKDRQRFPNSRCILSISVGQPYHEGKKFEATLKLISKSFKECLVLVGDILQRHTIALRYSEKSENELYDMSIQAGDLWIERSKLILDKALSIPYSITRWHQWLYHPKFQDYYNTVLGLYKTDSEYKMLVDKEIEAFLTRCKHTKDLKIAYELSVKYILEECAAIGLLVEAQYEFEVYPSFRNQAMTFIYHKFIKLLPTQLFKPLTVGFNKIVYKRPMTLEHGL